ncbi:MAG: histidine kinase dimerization/phospho-acceptor domain-containing protein [Fuerstiella sp.]|nr:PAS domain-containing hybrid sensor histidine kinase/response regulator [Fuerstiella sp.]
MLLLFVTGTVGFFAFRTFLKLVLKHLDPSQVVPRRVREALDILVDGLMIIGLDGRILLANAALSNVAGHAPDEMLGKHAKSLGFRVTGVPMSLPWECCAELKNAISSVPMQIDTPDGLMSFNVNCSPLMGNEGQHRGVLATFDNITQLEEKKQQLSLARDDAEAANRAKSDFLANMSHEIRNPMNAIVGFTDILRRGMAADAESQQDYLNTIHASGEHLVGLINDILDLSKIEAGKLELQECRPHQLIAEVVNVLGMKAEQQNLALEHEIVGTIPETIESDPTRLRQVLMNLVGNAVKFTQTGSVRIVTDLLETTDRPLLRFKVVDTGIR